MNIGTALVHRIMATLTPVFLLVPAVTAAQPTHSITELKTATFIAPSMTEQAARRVNLPHLWRHEGSTVAFALYKLPFVVTAGARDFAIFIDGTNLPFEATVNGQHAHETGGRHRVQFR